MKIVLSPQLQRAIRQVLDEGQSGRRILDVYKAASEIQSLHPDENVALEDIAFAIASGGLEAVELDSSMVALELVVPSRVEKADPVAD